MTDGNGIVVFGRSAMMSMAVSMVMAVLVLVVRVAVMIVVIVDGGTESTVDRFCVKPDIRRGACVSGVLRAHERGRTRRTGTDLLC